MFGRKEKLETESIIGKETEFKGTLKGEGSIRIEGRVDGKIEVEGDVSMGENAMIKANIKAGSITISGTVEGNIDCKGRVEILPSGTLKGGVKASDLTIAEGAFFEGQCKMVPSSGSKLSAT